MSAILCVAPRKTKRCCVQSRLQVRAARLLKTDLCCYYDGWRARAGPAPHVEDRAGVLVVVGKVVGKGRAALLHAWM